MEACMRRVFSALVACTILGSTLVARQAAPGELAGTIRNAAGVALPGVSVTLVQAGIARFKTVTDHRGEFSFEALTPSRYELIVEAPGVGRTSRTVTVRAGTNPRLTIVVQPVAGQEKSADANRVDERRGETAGGREMASPPSAAAGEMHRTSPSARAARMNAAPPFNTEAYAHIAEGGFRRVADHPLSTFSVDVDTASYSNVRRFLRDGKLPPADAVRTEELLNYFRFDYAQPDDEHPFSVTTELGACPWNPAHRLALVGLQGRRMVESKTAARNLVFLLDVSGSMMPPNKLPLVKTAMRLLADTLTEADRVAIVVYAGASGIALGTTSGADRHAIRQALESLAAGGSTNGAAGIHAAYDLASSSFIRGGNNRVILATDGDFNVGVTSEGELVRLIEEKRASGIFLSVLGVGEGNLQDSRMEKLADSGNGNYAYLDSVHEARRVLVEEAGGTLVTIAKDVKVQVEFNPRVVSAYRLIGYENRTLQNEDFNDDRKDAGEIGAGHTVTALYEIVPPGVPIEGAATVDPLKYQRNPDVKRTSSQDELMTVKLRYKEPDGDASRLMTIAVSSSNTRARSNLGFASAVAEFGMLLRRSEHRGTASYAQVLELARAHRGPDSRGYRAEFLKLVGMAAAIDGQGCQDPRVQGSEGPNLPGCERPTVREF
jgi:Ca-activated chloride channel family protein